MGYEMLVGLFCVAAILLYASRRSRPDALPARVRGAIRRK